MAKLVTGTTINGVLAATILDIEQASLEAGLLSQVTRPTPAVLATDSGAVGNLNGTYYYSVTFYTAIGETDDGGIYSLALSVTNKKVNLSNIPTSSDARVIGRNIYRTTGSPVDPVLRSYVATIADNTTTTYQDNTADVALGTPVPAVNTTEYILNIDGANLINVGNSSLSVGRGNGTLGYANTAIGNYSMSYATSAYRNVAVGLYSQYKITTGTRNTAIGIHSSNDNETGNENTAVGYGALHKNTVSYNTAVGSSTLHENTTGTGNTAVGRTALYTNITGNYNTAVGFSSLFSSTAGYNTALGYYAAWKISTGTNNVALGYTAGAVIADGATANETSFQSVYLGAASKASADGIQNEIVIGYSAIGSGLNTVTLGNTSILKTILRGNVGIGLTPADGSHSKLEVSGDLLLRNAAVSGYRKLWFNLNYEDITLAPSRTAMICKNYDDPCDFNIYGSYADSNNGGDIIFYRDRVNEALRIVGLAKNNIGIGGVSTFGTNATNTIGLKVGIVPANKVADVGQLCVVDLNGAGTCGWKFVNELANTAYTMTGVSGVTAAAAGAGTVKMGSANPADNAGWMTMLNHLGEEVFVPYWTTATP